MWWGVIPANIIIMHKPKNAHYVTLILTETKRTVTRRNFFKSEERCTCWILQFRRRVAVGYIPNLAALLTRL
jgi:hypothetical protein